jgi:ParB-like chromosome segregation protein Spo0J
MKNNLPQIKLISIKDIRISPGEHRRTNQRKVSTLADSIRAIGLQNPITVRLRQNGDVDLIAGRHRVAALKLLRRDKIKAIVMEGGKIQRCMWTIAENLHRAGLLKLERAESITKWKALLKKLNGDGEKGVRGGRQPKDEGVSKAAQALEVSREEVRFRARCRVSAKRQSAWRRRKASITIKPPY